MAVLKRPYKGDEEESRAPEVGEAGDWKRKRTSGWSELRLWLARMLNKAPKLKSTVKTKMKSNLNVRPASEAMVGNVAEDTACRRANVNVDCWLRFAANAN